MDSVSPGTLAAEIAAAAAGVAAAWGACRLLTGRSFPRGRETAAWILLAALWGTGGRVLAERYLDGLGSVTHLTDTFPWGVWKFNVLWGIACGAGGFTMAGTVYIFRAKPFYPVLRPAVLTAYLGYMLLGCASLMVDIGRPLNFWSPIVHWQHRSVLFEIFWCILLYTGVLTVEFAPVVLEKVGMSKLGHFIHRFTIPFVIGGVIFSTLHQSSLGSLYLIVPTKLVPLWYTPLLPLFFFLSAIAVGLSMVVIVSALCRRFLGKGVEDRVIVSLGRFVTVVLLLFLGIRVLDMTLRDAWVAIFDYPLQGALFLVEEGALAAAAVILLLRPWQARAGDVRAAAVLVLVGVVLHRLNVAWFGLIPALGSAYVPSWKEIAVTLMLISLATVVFALAAKYLDLFQEGAPNPTPAAGGIAESSAVRGTRPEPAAAK